MFCSSEPCSAVYVPHTRSWSLKCTYPVTQLPCHLICDRVPLTASCYPQITGSRKQTTVSSDAENIHDDTELPAAESNRAWAWWHHFHAVNLLTSHSFLPAALMESWKKPLLLTLIRTSRHRVSKNSFYFERHFCGSLIHQISLFQGDVTSLIFGIQI